MTTILKKSIFILSLTYFFPTNKFHVKANRHTETLGKQKNILGLIAKDLSEIANNNKRYIGRADSDPKIHRIRAKTMYKTRKKPSIQLSVHRPSKLANVNAGTKSQDIGDKRAKLMDNVLGVAVMEKEMKDEIRASKNNRVDKIYHTLKSRPNHGSLDKTQDTNTSPDNRNETLIISEDARLYGPDSDEIYQKVSGENGLGEVEPKSGPDEKNTDEVLDWASEPDRSNSKVTPDIPYIGGYYTFTNEKDTKSQSLEEADGLIMNALQVMIQSIKDQNNIILQQIKETSQMGAAIEDLRQETKTHHAKFDTKTADIDKLTGKINLLTQRVGDFLQQAETRQEILEDKIDGLEDELITSRTHGAEENGEPGWGVGETQPLNPKLNTPRTNTKDCRHVRKWISVLCQDGSFCNLSKHGSRCCRRRGGRKASPSFHQFMCVGGCYKAKSRSKQKLNWRCQIRKQSKPVVRRFPRRIHRGLHIMEDSSSREDHGKTSRAK